jgi:hypothetical protein
VDGKKLPQEHAPPARTPAPKPKLTWGKKAKEDMVRGPTKPRKTPVAQSVPQGEKRKLRSPGELNNVSLLESKGAKSKSKSPPSGEGVKAVMTQASASEECSIRDPPRGHDQVYTMIIYGRLFETFSHMDSTKCTRRFVFKRR